MSIQIRKVGQHNIAVMSLQKSYEKYIAAEPFRYNEKASWVKGSRTITKAEAQKKIISAPFSMAKLLDQKHNSEYYSGCVRAIKRASVIEVECSNADVMRWFENGTFADNDYIELLQNLIGSLVECGNGFLLKLRDLTKAWVGFERMIPTEIQIYERYNNNMPEGDYLQTRNNLKTIHENKEVIHLKTLSEKSIFWGCPDLAIVKKVLIMKEIDAFNYNNFANGLLIDYFLIIEGGTLKDNEIVDDEGKEVVGDAYDLLQAQIQEATGNDKSHGTILIESDNPDVKIRLEPLRQSVPEGGFINLYDQLRNGMFAYFGTPPKIVSQFISGSLGDSTQSDMIVFYNWVVKPLQRKLATILAKHFNEEYGWGVKWQDFNFGDITELFDVAGNYFKTVKTNV
jgi:hypothetical protein